MEETNQQMLLRLAREARHIPTPAEKELWECLRAHRCGGLHFRRQEIIGPFRLDFYCRKVKLAIEVDGGIHHINSVQQRDVDRQQILEQNFGICFCVSPTKISGSTSTKSLARYSHLRNNS